MKNLKTALLLFLLIIVMTSISCNTPETPGDPTGNSISNTSVKTSSSGINTTKELKPDLPEVDMKGKTITILTSGWGDYEPFSVTDIAPVSENGEVLNDAAYKRKTTIEQQYNCIIKDVYNKSYEESNSLLQKSVTAQDGLYDIAMLRGRFFSAMITGGYLLDLSTLDNVNFDMPWWEKGAYEALSVKNKHFGICGDISTNEMMAVWTVCFNKKLIKDMSLEDPYKLVNSGKWTFDKTVEMAKSVAKDLDGDQKMTAADLWGITYTHDTIIGMLNSCGVIIAQPGTDGGIKETLKNDKAITRILDIFTKVTDEIYSIDTLGVLKMPGQDGKLFGENKSLFMFTATHTVNELRKLDVDFGLIPYPKYNETEEYKPYTAGIFLPIICIPKTNLDLTNTSIFMEAFAYQGYKQVVPAFYDLILKVKLARDTESVDMLDYIYGNIGFDTGNILNIGKFVDLLAQQAIKKDLNIASFLETNIPILETDIKNIEK